MWIIFHLGRSSWRCFTRYRTFMNHKKTKLNTKKILENQSISQMGVLQFPLIFMQYYSYLYTICFRVCNTHTMQLLYFIYILFTDTKILFKSIYFYYVYCLWINIFILYLLLTNTNVCTILFIFTRQSQDIFLFCVS